MTGSRDLAGLSECSGPPLAEPGRGLRGAPGRPSGREPVPGPGPGDAPGPPPPSTALARRRSHRRVSISPQAVRTETFPHGSVAIKIAMRVSPKGLRARAGPAGDDWST
jgi:hypothetical protein